MPAIDRRNRIVWQFGQWLIEVRQRIDTGKFDEIDVVEPGNGAAAAAEVEFQRSAGGKIAIDGWIQNLHRRSPGAYRQTFCSLRSIFASPTHAISGGFHYHSCKR